MQGRDEDEGIYRVRVGRGGEGGEEETDGENRMRGKNHTRNGRIVWKIVRWSSAHDGKKREEGREGRKERRGGKERRRQRAERE